MSLVQRNPGDTIRSLDIDQLVYLVTGLMADQAVSMPSMTVYGTFAVAAISGPTISSAALTGSAGASQWWFRIVPVYNGTDGPPGPAFRTPALGPATLTGSNYYTVVFPFAPGATGYKLIGATGGSSPALASYAQLGTTLAAINGSTSYSMLANAATTAYTTITVPLGGGGATRPWRCRAHTTGSQADTAGVSTILHLDTEDVDPTSSYNPATYTFTVPQPGEYLCLASFLSANFTAGDRNISVYKNGTLFEQLGGSTTTATGGNARPSGGCLVPCNAGDTLDFRVQTPGSTAGGVTAGYASIIYECPL